MERILVWGFLLYQTFKKWYYTKNSISYYMITEQGKQIPIFHDWDEPIWGFLTVYNNNYEYKYKFTPNFVIDDLNVPEYKWMGLQVIVHNKYHMLNVNEFLVFPNFLFTNPMKLWLCHKLQVEPTTEMDITLVDENVNLFKITQSIELHNNKYLIDQQT
jgi:hypothetical protein